MKLTIINCHIISQKWMMTFVFNQKFIIFFYEVSHKIKKRNLLSMLLHHVDKKNHFITLTFHLRIDCYFFFYEFLIHISFSVVSDLYSFIAFLQKMKEEWKTCFKTITNELLRPFFIGFFFIWMYLWFLVVFFLFGLIVKILKLRQAIQMYTHIVLCSRW